MQRNLELAALFTRCKMQPQHVRLALRSAMLVNKKVFNNAAAAKFAQRLIDLNPDPKVVQQVRTLG